MLGERVLPHARMALTAVRSVEQVAADATGTMTGTVRLASTPTVCQGLVPGLLRHWREDQPRITVRVFEGDSGEVAAWLEDGTADAAVLIDPPPGPGIQLATDAYRALLPRDHPLADEPRVDIRDLEDDLVPDLTQRACEARVRTIHSLAGLRFSPTHRVRDLATLISMVQAGLGVTVLSEVSRSLIAADLVLLPLTPQTSRRLVLTGPRARPWHPALRTLAESAAGHLARSVSRPARTDGRTARSPAAAAEHPAGSAAGPVRAPARLRPAEVTAGRHGGTGPSTGTARRTAGTRAARRASGAARPPSGRRRSSAGTPGCRRARRASPASR